jgi:hypothetical protein
MSRGKNKSIGLAAAVFLQGALEGIIMDDEMDAPK